MIMAYSSRPDRVWQQVSQRREFCAGSETMKKFLLLAVLVSLLGCARHDPSAAPQPDPSVVTARPASMPTGKLIDLTHLFDEQTIYWPTEAGFLLERGNNGLTDKGYYYAANRFRAAEHGGTHVDAPIH